MLYRRLRVGVRCRAFFGLWERDDREYFPRCWASRLVRPVNVRARMAARGMALVGMALAAASRSRQPEH